MEKEHGLAESVKLRFPSTAGVIVQARPLERQLFLLELGEELRTGTKAVIVRGRGGSDRPLLVAW